MIYNIALNNIINTPREISTYPEEVRNAVSLPVFKESIKKVDESQNGGNKNIKHVKFPEKRMFFTP